MSTQLWVSTLAVVALASACDFASGAACETDDNCPEQAPLCVDIVDGVGQCAFEDASFTDAGDDVDGGAGDAGPGDGGGADSGQQDAGTSDSGPDDAGDQDGGAGDGGGANDGGGDDDGGVGDGGARDGGGGDGGTGDPCIDGVEPDAGTLSVTAGFAFPITRVTTDEPTMLIRGSAWDDVKVCSVTVNGAPGQYVFATRTWTVDVPLEMGDNELELVVTAPNNEAVTMTGTTVHRVAALPVEPRGAAVVVDGDGNTLIVTADNTTSEIYGVMPATGETVYVSGARRGAGAPEANIDFPFDVASARGTTDLWVTNRVAVVHVDTTSGDRELVASISDANGPSGTWPYIAAHDNGQVVYLYDDNASLILSMDTATKIRSVVSSGSRGTGPSLTSGNSFAFADGKLYLASHEAGFQIIEIDPGTGDRTIIASSTVGTGPIPSGAGPISLDDTTTSAPRLIMMSQDGNLYTIVPSTRGRAQVADLQALSDQRQASGIDSDGDNIYVLDHEQEGFHIYSRVNASSTLLPNTAGSGARFDWPNKIMADPTGQFLYVSDRQKRVHRVLLNGGGRLIISSDTIHSADGYAYGSISDLELDDSGLILVADRSSSAIWRLSGANRSAWQSNAGFPAGEQGVGTPMNAPVALTRGDTAHMMLQGGNDNFVSIAPGSTRTAIDDSGLLEPGVGDVTYSFGAGAFFATNPVSNTVVKYDGNVAAVFSTGGVGVGEPSSFNGLTAISSGADGLWVLHQQPEGIVKIDETTGDRSWVSAAFEGSGPMFDGAQGMHTEAQTAWVSSFSRNAIIVVDLVTGTRAIVSQ